MVVPAITAPTPGSSVPPVHDVYGTADPGAVVELWYNLGAGDQATASTSIASPWGEFQFAGSEPAPLGPITWFVKSAGVESARVAVTVADLGPSTATVYDLEPDTAPVGPITCTVTGSGFVALSQVTVNGATLTTSYLNPSQLRAAMPAAQAGTVQVGVRNPGEDQSTTLTFTITAATARGPTLDEVRAWIQVPATVIDDAQLQTVVDGETAIQSALCAGAIPPAPAPLPAALIQGLYRRVARVIRLRSLPTGMVGDSDEFGPIQAARHDAEITRLEATYRDPVLG